MSHSQSQAQNLVDVEFALSQLGGNSDLLKRMLIRFQQEFVSVPKAVKDFIAAGDIKEAKMKVHTTKGLSGNLGLMAVFECTKILDQQLRENEINNTQIDLFETLMADTCLFINTVDLVAKDAPVFTSDNQSNRHTDEFILRLERHEFIDDETLHGYINDLNLPESGKTDLIALVEELKYAEAIELIRNIP